jgi:phosphatidylserine/phosphatidylglycerophosphate/cardiolipin synthase-like enzyme
MTVALFTSRDGGAALKAAVREVIALIGRRAAAGTERLDLQIMCFAFTDREIAADLAALAAAHPRMSLRLLADWSQGAATGPAILDALAEAAPPSLYVKFKLDLPYRPDPATGRLRYSYAASRGMLHHKTMCLLADGRPAMLAIGSFNWSARGQRAYENLVLLPDTPDHGPVMAGFAAEFEAIWSDHRLSATPGRARRVAARLRADAAAGADLADPARIADILGLAGETPRPGPQARQPAEGRCLAAFSGSPVLPGAAQAGHAARNDRRSLNLLRPSGARRPAPLTLHTLALEAIRSVPDGATLAVAAYALSPRVPEFGAMIAAARRGVRLRLLLDGRIGRPAAKALLGFAAREGLPLDLRLSGRRMHQKYLCCAEAGLVLTGTANMTADAVERHSDHRVLFREAPVLAAAFQADFDTIWSRLSAPAA